MWEFQGTMLTAEDLVRRRTKTDFILPTKGPKCFTPSGSWLETKQLQTLLDATKTLIAEERVERENALAQAEWDENLKVAIVTRVVGRQFEKFGHEENMSIFLHPEEALYLLETNHLQLLYGGVSMSIQQAYTVLLGPKTGCCFVEYMVFSHLLKNGFKILRHSPKRTVTRYERLIGLYVDPLKNRKSRRKCIVPKKGKSCESNKKKIKTDKGSQKKNEKRDSPEHNNVELCLSCDSKKNEPADKVVGMPFEAIMDNNSSIGSDIEILSEKNVCRSEESLYYTEYSSSASDDSDCQVIEEINTEANVPKTDIKRFYGNKMIEEINLSDSECSDVVGPGPVNSNIVGPGCVKNEIISEVRSCEVTELKESTSLQEEQRNSNVSCDNENNTSRNCSVVESTISESNDCNDSFVVEQTSSIELKGSVCVAQEIQVEQTIERNNISVTSTDDHEKQSVVLEDSKGISESICILNEIKEEDYCPLSMPLQRESVIRRNAATTCKKEMDNTVALSTQPKEEEIEVIELDDENSDNGILEDKKTILLSFPNVAGCHIFRCDVPPQRLCPPNVCPNQQSYNIDLERLQDPLYGGNPKKKRNISDGRFHQYARHENTNQAKMFRFNTPPNRQYNRFSNDNNFNNSPDGRNERWRDIPNQSRNEGFADHSEFSPFREQLMYPNFQQSSMDQSDQNYYPHFSGHPMRNLAPFQNQRANFRSRGNPNREMFRQNSPFRNCRFRSSRSHRFPRRRSRGGRNVRGGRYFGSRDREDNESFDAVDGNYVPCNVDHTHSSYEQPRRTRQSSVGEKRHRRSYDENINASNTREKRPRRTRGNYFPPNRNSRDLLQFLDIIHPDTTIGNTVPNSGPNLSRSDCDNNPNDFLETGRNASAFAETESTDNSSTAGRSSCSDSCSSEGSSEESADEYYENEAERNSISVLLKSDDLEDIDTCLKSLEIVHTVKFRGLAAESDEPLLSIKFDLYQPSTPFRRSNPPVPDFRVVVMQPDQNLPTSRQLGFLGEGFDDDVPLLFAIASTDSVAFYLQSVVDLPSVSSKDKVQG